MIEINVIIEYFILSILFAKKNGMKCSHEEFEGD